MSLQRRLSSCVSLILALSPAHVLAQASKPPDAPPPPVADAPSANEKAPAAPPANPPAAPPANPPAAPPAEKGPAPTPDDADEEVDDAGDDVAVEEKAEPSAGGETESESSDTEEPADEDSAEEEPGRPPPKGKGVVWGVVKDTEGELIEAPVQVIGHKKAEAVTDEQGHYRLELPPGTYSLRFSYELHKSSRIDHVVVTAGKTVRIDTQLLSDEEAVDVVEVVEEADRSTVEGTTIARQKASAVGDSVGRAEISRTPAANAAQAAQRVVGATIVGGRFVYVRGLGERYTNALLNGAPLPSPEPDRAAVPLDVFPSLIIDNLSIVKTFTPDVPADFAGGSVRIQTRELPTKPLIQGSISLGYDDGSTFRHRLSQRGSSTDWLGFDDGTRDLPKELRNKLLTIAPEPGEPGHAAYLQTSQRLNSFMSAQRSFTPPNHSVSAVAGDGWSLGGDQRLGALVTVNYSRGFTANEGGITRTFSAGGPGGITLQNDYRLAFGNDRVTWGALGSVSYWPSAKHRLTLLGIHTQIADSTAQLVEGYDDNRHANISSTRLRYVSRALNFGQLRGEHDFPELLNARLEWNTALSGASRSEPDTRDTVFQSAQGDVYTATNTPENGSHLNAEQGETAVGGGLDFTQPISRDADATKFKVGGLVSIKSRDFKARRFHYSPAGVDPATGFPFTFSCGLTVARDCADGLFTPGNIDSGQLVLNAEDTRAEDAYRASLNVYAGYAMVDLALGSRVRLVGGARVESTKQKLDPYSQFGTASNPKSARVDATDVLPAVNIAYSATKSTKLRLAATRTLARPQLRELAPFTYANYFGAMPFAGNQNLKLTYINNYDTRFEFYPTLREVMAFSFFAKTFKDPIENIVVDSGGGVLQPQNSVGATLLGVEFEARKSLDFVPALRDFNMIANLTLAHSKVEILKTATISVTNVSRPLMNQAPYVINVALDYENEGAQVGGRVLYNVSGERIVEVGSRGIPDAYLKPVHSIDMNVHKGFAKHFDIKLTATNLLASDTIVTIKPKAGKERIMRRHYDGQSLLSDSRVFTIAGSYTY